MMETYEQLEQRCYALALTIKSLRNVVTDSFESKEEFIGRVRKILGSDPDERVKNEMDKNEMLSLLRHALPCVDAYARDTRLKQADADMLMLLAQIKEICGE